MVIGRGRLEALWKALSKAMGKFSNDTSVTSLRQRLR